MWAAGRDLAQKVGGRCKKQGTPIRGELQTRLPRFTEALTALSCYTIQAASTPRHSPKAEPWRPAPILALSKDRRA